jgi:hypothetical protein
MKRLKAAIYNALCGNTRLVALLGHPSAISQAWPAQEARYTDSQIGQTYENLPQVDPPRARLTFVLVNPLMDRDLPKRDDGFQLSVMSPNGELVEEIVAECERTLDQNSADFKQWVTETIIKETYCTRGPDLYESDTRMFHAPMNLRVLWDP